MNFIFEHVPCRFVITQRIVSQDLFDVFFFFKFNPEVLLSPTILSMRIWSSQARRDLLPEEELAAEGDEARLFPSSQGYLGHEVGQAAAQCKPKQEEQR